MSFNEEELWNERAVAQQLPNPALQRQDSMTAEPSYTPPSSQEPPTSEAQCVDCDDEDEEMAGITYHVQDSDQENSDEEEKEEEALRPRDTSPVEPSSLAGRVLTPTQDNYSSEVNMDGDITVARTLTRQRTEPAVFATSEAEVDMDDVVNIPGRLTLQRTEPAFNQAPEHDTEMPVENPGGPRRLYSMTSEEFAAELWKGNSTPERNADMLSDDEDSRYGARTPTSSPVYYHGGVTRQYHEEPSRSFYVAQDVVPAQNGEKSSPEDDNMDLEHGEQGEC